jgi:hypothetical protein
MHHESEVSKEMQEAIRDALLSREDLPDEVLKALQQPGVKLSTTLGPTGQFPEGKLTENDEGEIIFGVGPLKGKVCINFGSPVASLGLSIDQARNLARVLRKCASQLQRERGKAGE